MKTSTEVLAPSLSKSDAQRIERDAKKHLDGFESNGFALAVDLRRLQDGAAHLLRGYPNFGRYIEDRFGGRVSAENAKKLSLTGKSVLALVDAGRVTLTPSAHRAAHKILGTTGARALSAVQGKHGTEAMISVYDTAAAIAREKGGVITDDIVAAVLQPQLPEPEPEPAPEPAKSEPPEPEPELSEAERNLLELLGNVQDACLTLENLIEHGGAGSERAAAYAADITTEAAQLKASLLAAVSG
jgi:hypothetical protein